MSMPLSDPIAIPNERDSHALGMREASASVADRLKQSDD
jgi:hypothetical protein